MYRDVPCRCDIRVRIEAVNGAMRKERVARDGV